MTIMDLASILNIEIVIRYHGNVVCWIARFEPSPELMRGAASVVGFHGIGKSPNEATQSLTREISGQRLVFDAMDPAMRREHHIPGLEAVDFGLKLPPTL